MTPLAEGDAVAAIVGIAIPAVSLLLWVAYFIREKRAHAALAERLARTAEAAGAEPPPKDRWRFRRPSSDVGLRLGDQDGESRLELETISRLGGAPDALLYLLALVFTGPIVFSGGALLTIPVREGATTAAIAAAEVLGGLFVAGLGALFARAILSVADRLAALEATPEGLVAETTRLGFLGRHRHRRAFADPVRVSGKLQHWAAREEDARRVYYLTLGGGALLGGTVYTIEDAAAGAVLVELLADRARRLGTS